MRYTKWFASLVLTGGMAVASTGAASAQEWQWRHAGNDSARIAELRNHIARDRARLREDIRRGREQAAARDAADLARDQRALEALRADRRDARDGYRDSGYYRDSYRGSNGNWR